MTVVENGVRGEEEQSKDEIQPNKTSRPEHHEMTNTRNRESHQQIESECGSGQKQNKRKTQEDHVRVDEFE